MPTPKMSDRAISVLSNRNPELLEKLNVVVKPPPPPTVTITTFEMDDKALYGTSTNATSLKVTITWNDGRGSEGNSEFYVYPAADGTWSVDPASLSDASGIYTVVVEASYDGGSVQAKASDEYVNEPPPPSLTAFGVAFEDGTLADFSAAFDPFDYDDYFLPDSFSRVDADSDGVFDFGVIWVSTAVLDGLYSGFLNGKSVTFSRVGYEPGEESAQLFFVADDDVFSADDLASTSGNLQTISIGITGSVDLNGVMLDFTFGNAPTGP